MKRTETVQTVLNALGSLIVVQGLLILIPLVPLMVYREYRLLPVFIITAAASVLVGFLLKKCTRPGKMYFVHSLLICGMAWIVLSAFSCIPLYFGTSASLLDSYFETVSGLTTTGITIYTNIEVLPRCIVFWRSLIQWLGGLGILTFFLAVTFRSTNTYFQLFAAESHKIDSSRPTPSIIKTVIILWTLYTTFTVSEMILLKVLGMSVFDAVCHSLTTLSTGGFSPYDASINYYREAGYAHYRAIEYVITFFMLLGGINFLMHYKFLRGRFRDVAWNTELRYFLGIIVIGATLVMLDHFRMFPGFSLARLEETFRHTIFTIISLLTTTGFGTIDINEPYFPAMSKQIFLVLMLIGGCVGSTGGGIKVLRIVVLYKAFAIQIKRLRLPRKALSEVVVDHKIVPNGEYKRISALFWGWLFLILIGGMITAFFTDLEGWAAFSGMFSAMGNIGPCYISVQQMSDLPAIVKLTYIFGMLAGRLEILPILLLLSPKAWK